MSAPLFFGGELDSFTRSSTSVVEDTGGGIGGAVYNSTWCRCAIMVPTGESFKSVTFASQTEIFVHFDLYFDAFNSGETEVFYLLDSGTAKFRLTANKYTPTLSNITWQMYRWNGSSFTAIGSSVVTSTALQTFDIYVNKTTGVATLYIGGSQQATGTGSMSSVTGFTQAEFLGGQGSRKAFWSQMFARTVTTVGRNLYTIVEDTNGAVQNWTGAVTDINEMVLDTSTNLTSTVNGDVSTYYKTGLDLSGKTILGIGTSALFNIGATGPQNLYNILRSGGLNYQSTIHAGTTGYAPGQYMWMADPNTGQLWTPTSAEAVQWGVEAAT